MTGVMARQDARIRANAWLMEYVILSEKILGSCRESSSKMTRDSLIRALVLTLAWRWRVHAHHSPDLVYDRVRANVKGRTVKPIILRLTNKRGHEARAHHAAEAGAQGRQVPAGGQGAVEGLSDWQGGEKGL
jgi:hypothetical protein